MSGLLTAEALAAVGLEKPLRRGVIAASDIQKYCVAVDDLNPLYFDRDAAREAGYADVIAPPLFPFAATRPTPSLSNLLDDGQFDNLAPPGLQHLQSMAASQDWHIFRPAVAGEEVIERVKFGSIEEKHGRNGNIVFVAEEGLVTTVSGDPIIRTVNRIAFRPIPAISKVGAATEIASMVKPVARPVTEVTEHGLIKRPSMISLFMFAASIWAVHRIHYDVLFAQSEGLPAPLIPGWMLAQYMTEYATSQARGRGAICSLSVRYQSFALAGDELTCRSVGDEGSEVKLAISNQVGVDVVSGTARYAGSRGAADAPPTVSEI